MRAAKLFGVGAALFMLALAAGNSGQVGLAQQSWQQVPCPPTQPYTFCTLSGYIYSINSVAFSPDGQLLASGSCGQEASGLCLEGEVLLWAVDTGQRVRALRGHILDIESVAFSPDGQFLASGGCNQAQAFLFILICIKGEIKLWEVATGKEVRSFVGHTGGGVTAVAFSPDGKLLASGGGFEDKTTKLWEVATGSLMRTLSGPREGVQAVVFHPNGQLVASGSRDNTTHFWEVATGRLVRIFINTADVLSVAISPDGQLLAAAYDVFVALWDIAKHEQVRTLQHTSVAQSVAFSPNGRFIAVGLAGKTVKIWEVNTGREVRTLSGHTDAITSVAFSPDGRLLASSSRDRTVKLWYVGDLTK